MFRPIAFIFLLAGFAVVLPTGNAALAAYDGANTVGSSSRGKQQFAKSIEDLPLMSGLRVMDEKDVLFISKSGRIAETVLEGEADIEDIYDFYSEALPQLGWKQIDPKTYEREKERLYIEASGIQHPKAVSVVKFSVRPTAQ